MFDEKRLQHIDYINAQIDGGMASDLILMTECRQERNVALIADQISADPKKKVILIAGPSSSGKTSTSKRLRVQLMACDKTPVTLSMDNWFVNRDKTPLDEEGKPDFESIYAMDLEQFNKDLSDLIEGKEVAMPTYNFVTGKREYRGESLLLTPDMILIIEGIHALNPLMTEGVPAEAKFKLFAAPMTAVTADGVELIPTHVTRLVRRICRDFQTRGKSAQATIEQWPSVRRGEDKWIVPFVREADTIFDTSIYYELAALKPIAEKVIGQVPEDCPEYDVAQKLLQYVGCFKEIGTDDIPRTSLLREFIGGSLFDVG